MSRISRTFTVSFPPELASEVETMAKEEKRNLSELFREAFRVYQQEREIRDIERLQRRLGPKLAAKGISTEKQVDELAYGDR